jgi:hypothetical protein
MAHLYPRNIGNGIPFARFVLTKVSVTDEYCKGSAKPVENPHELKIKTLKKQDLSQGISIGTHIP